MPKILIVDDSEVDRVFARRVLQDQGDFDVVCAGGAKEALTMIGGGGHDAVVTDLVMPEMDGLELVRELRDTFPALPVIIMTAKGGEEMAVHALQQGAASYVPKRVLEQDLCDTVDSVVAAAAQRLGRAELFRSMINSQWSFRLGNDRALFRPLIQYVHDTFAGFGLFDESERTRLGVALEEALNNAAEHGNLELDSKDREADLAAYIEQMQSRCSVPPYCDRQIHLEIAITPAEVVFSVSDEGRGFDPTELADPHHPENLDAISGRGITLMRMFMDDVRFNETGNRVRMSKRTADSP